MDKAIEKYKDSIRKLVEGENVPGDPLLGAPVIELQGNRILLIERHGGITEYSDNMIRTEAKDMTIEVIGTDLVITAMSKTHIRVNGEVEKISFSKREDVG